MTHSASDYQCSRGRKEAAELKALIEEWVAGLPEEDRDLVDRWTDKICVKLDFVGVAYAQELIAAVLLWAKETEKHGLPESNFSHSDFVVRTHRTRIQTAKDAAVIPAQSAIIINPQWQRILDSRAVADDASG